MWPFGKRKNKITIELTENDTVVSILEKLMWAEGVSQSKCREIGHVKNRIKREIEPMADWLGRCRAVLVDWRSTIENPAVRKTVDGIIADMDDAGLYEKRPDYNKEGSQTLSTWFGLSYASFAVLPRVMMGQMPDRWQLRMAHLLQEFDAQFSNVPDDMLDFIVRRRGEKGRMAKLPEVLTNYRYPHYMELQKWQRDPLHSREDFDEAVQTLDKTITREQIGKWLASNAFDGYAWTWENAEACANHIGDGLAFLQHAKRPTDLQGFLKLSQRIATTLHPDTFLTPPTVEAWLKDNPPNKDGSYSIERAVACAQFHVDVVKAL